MGKYTGLQDAYLSVVKALQHAAIMAQRRLVSARWYVVPQLGGLVCQMGKLQRRESERKEWTSGASLRYDVSARMPACCLSGGACAVLSFLAQHRCGLMHAPLALFGGSLGMLQAPTHGHASLGHSVAPFSLAVRFVASRYNPMPRPN